MQRSIGYTRVHLVFLPETFVCVFAVSHGFQSIFQLLNLMRYFLDSLPAFIKCVL